ncbi:hypothetical protein ACN267_18525 [Micromonospora sp. WMMD734]|uniref:Dynamin family protein n=1 Tax=Micromonospora humidisoli TaxID=2807622 RepID=A0ABS2J3X7_9ACTN|nr:hypothetical protein [Micromonospora humidisoli]MBM7081272.1 hypothetical protein [Micromonospora humidisoli]
MKPGPLSEVDMTDDPSDHPDAAGLPSHGPLPAHPWAVEVDPDEPLAVVAAGPAGAARREVLAALLGVPSGMLATPAGSCLLVRHARVATRAAYVPGYRQPHSYGADQAAAGPALARAPRRVELSLPEPLLRHFAVLDTPDTDTLGVAGGRILLDAVVRAGALLFVIGADQTFTAAELHLIAEVARSRVRVFFVVTPGAGGWAATEPAATDDTGVALASPPDAPPAGGPVDPVAVTVAAHRATLLSAVPELAEADWYPVHRAEHPALRRALVGWSAIEGLRRASSRPPVPPGAHGRVPVAPEPPGDDWADGLARQSRLRARGIRQQLALELANIHLRAVQEIVFGVGCAGLPQLLDRELEALSLLATQQQDRVVREILDGATARIFGGPVAEGVRQRIGAAVRWGLADHPSGQELDRVLLVTGTAGVAVLPGAGALDALLGHPGAPRTEVLPRIGVALSGGCWQHWRSPGNDDPNAARSWVQRALREVELELSREVSRRFEAFRLALDAVLTDALDHGILLA